MFPTWRLRLREARVAVDSGRYDDASRVLADESLREFLPAKRLARDVADKIVERARDRFAVGDSIAGWKDLLTAARRGGPNDAIAKVRHEYSDAAHRDARKYLAAGEPAAALLRLEKLQKRGLVDESVRTCTQIAQLMQESAKLAAHGHFAEAAAPVRRAEHLAQLGDSAGIMNDVAAHLASEAERLESTAGNCERLNVEMHSALAAENWSAVLSAADALLA